MDCNSELSHIAGLFCDNEMDTETIEKSTLETLKAIGEDPQREGLQKTPARVAKAYSEILSGYRTDPVALINGAFFEVEYDEMVIVKDIEFASCGFFKKFQGFIEQCTGGSPVRRPFITASIVRIAIKELIERVNNFFCLCCFFHGVCFEKQVGSKHIIVYPWIPVIGPSAVESHITEVIPLKIRN